MGPQPLTHLSTFTGIGGFDLAFEASGFESVGQVEIDKNANTVLERHWPDVPRWEDIHDVTGRDVPNGLTVISGGFPCQDYSIAGTMSGLAGDRGALWWELHRLIAESSPTWVVGENVPGLLASRDGRDFGTIVDSLVELGYGVVWAVLDSSKFGLAQRRRRLFIVGHSGGIPRPEVLALAEGLYGHPEPSRETEQADPGTPEASSPNGRGPISFNWQASRADYIGGLEEMTGALHVGQVPAVAWDSYNSQMSIEITPTMGVNTGTATGRAGVVSHPVPFAQNTRDEVRIVADGHLAGALAAEPGMKQTTYLADNQVIRRLTPVECARLQGFPDTWNDHLADGPRYKQYGNAVSVPVVSWIARNLRAAEDADKA